ncbi:MAG TPA: MoaD/ThiS family protein [Anaerolineae bacterium]|jgi:molybdopterin synthase sulfur carrier subunit
MVTLYVPTPIRRLTGGKAKVQVAAANLHQVIEHAEKDYPGFRDRVLDADGQVKRFINIFVNGVDIRTLHGQDTIVRDGDEVTVVPAMAGGR